MGELTVFWDEFILSFSSALDILSSEIADHHFDVAYIAINLLEEIKGDKALIGRVAQAALLHDVGIFSLKERHKSLNFEFEEEHLHAELGAQLLSGYSGLKETAEIVRYHHCPYSDSRFNTQVPFESEVIFLADRIAVLIDKNKNVLRERQNLIKAIEGHKGSKFNPLLVEAFLAISKKEGFWLDLLNNCKPYVNDKLSGEVLQISYKELMDISLLFARIIDFKSSYTAAHSRGVGLMASKIAEICGYSKNDQNMFYFTGIVHDLGKIIIPLEILDKPSVVTRDEMLIIRAHPYYTKLILKSISGLGQFQRIASEHHERVDATGYPFRIGGDLLTQESRIIAVADVFTALTENRPYRETLRPNKVKEALRYFMSNDYLDDQLIKKVINYQKDLTLLNKSCQEEALEEYLEINRHVELMKKKYYLD